MPVAVKFKTKLAQIFVDTITRSLGAEDIFFREIAMSESLHRNAIVIAKNEVYDGVLAKEDMKARIADLLVNPTRFMEHEAVNTAAKVTFQNTNAITDMISRGMSAGKGKSSEDVFESAFRRDVATYVAAGVDVVAPFRKTPTNILFRIIDYTPAGFVKAVVKASSRSVREELLGRTDPDSTRKTFLGEDRRGLPSDYLGVGRGRLQKELIEDISKGLTGTAVIAAGYLAASAGLLIGNMPEDKPDKDQAVAEGQIPNSMLIYGRYRSLNRFSPIGNLFLIGAFIYEAEMEGKGLMRTVRSTTEDVLKMLLDQAFLQGVSGLFKAVENPDRYGDSYVNRLVSSIVPNILNKMARVVDPVQRAPESNAWGMVQSFANKIPYANKLFPVPARIDALGNPILYPSGDSTFYKRAMGIFFSPFPSRKRKEDPLFVEAKRIGVTINEPSKTISRTKLTNEEWQWYQERQGHALEVALRHMMNGYKYREADIHKKIEMWKRHERAVATQHNNEGFPLLMIKRYDLDKRDRYNPSKYYDAIRKTMENIGGEPVFQNASKAKQRDMIIERLRKLGINHP